MTGTTRDPATPAKGIDGADSGPITRRWVVALLLIGAAVRIAVFLPDRALWVDEAMLGANLAQRSYSQLAEPLQFEQMAPVGYLMLTRLSIETFGDNERALRLPALLAGLASLPLFALMALRLLPGRAALVALGLFVLSEPLVYYAAELKPYAFDALAAAALTWLALRFVQRGWRAGDAAGFALASATLVWFTWPTIIVTAGLLSCMLLSAWRGGGSRAALIVVVAGIVCGAAIAANYVLFMSPGETGEYMRRFWGGSGAFLPVPPRSLDDVKLLAFKPLDFFIDPMRYQSFGLAALAAIIGAAALWRCDRNALLMLVSPILIAAALSILKMYPFATSDHFRHPMLGRVLLFTVPLVLILIGHGLWRLACWPPRCHRLLLAVMLVLLLVHPLRLIAEHARNTSKPHDIRSALAMLEQHAQASDAVYVNWAGLMVAEYYWPHYDIPADRPDTIRVGDRYVINVTDVTQFDEHFKRYRGRRVWVLFVHSPDLPSHRRDENYLGWRLPQIGQRLPLTGVAGGPEMFNESNVSLHLYRLDG